MKISAIYQFIWDHGVVLDEAPSWGYVDSKQILDAMPKLTEQRLTERNRKSPHMTPRTLPGSDAIVGWFVHVLPKSCYPMPKWRPRISAPLPGKLEKSAVDPTVVAEQLHRVSVLGWVSCIPTASVALRGAADDTPLTT